MNEAKLDLFPAQVTTPSTRYRRARVYINDDRELLVWTEAKGIELVERVAVTEVQLSKRRTVAHEVVTASGETWQVLRSGSCGCGSRLKTMDPKAWSE